MNQKKVDHSALRTNQVFISGLLVLAFVLPATWHVIDLGRHLGWGLSLYFLALLTGGLVLLARLYPDALPKIWSPLSKAPMS